MKKTLVLLLTLILALSFMTACNNENETPDINTEQNNNPPETNDEPSSLSISDLLENGVFIETAYFSITLAEGWRYSLIEYDDDEEEIISFNAVHHNPEVEDLSSAAAYLNIEGYSISEIVELVRDEGVRIPEGASSSEIIDIIADFIIEGSIFAFEVNKAPATVDGREALKITMDDYEARYLVIDGEIIYLIDYYSATEASFSVADITVMVGTLKFV
jgi:hypothetical protein